MIVLKESKNIEKVRKNMPNYNTITDLSDFFKILGDSTRLQILMALERSELCVSELSHLLNMTISAISHQLKVLRLARLIKSRKVGKEVFYSLDDDHVLKIYKMAIEHVTE